MTAKPKWYENPECMVATEDGRRAYYNTFFARASGRQCLCHLDTIVMALPEDTPAECMAKLKMIGLINTIRQLAGVNDKLKVIEGQGRVAGRPKEKDKIKTPKTADMYNL